MARPVVSEVAEELYTILAPLAYDDANQDWALLVFCEAWAGPLQLVKDYTGDGTRPNWSNLIDIDECPDEALEWLAQLAGTNMPGREGGEIDDTYFTRARAYIKSTPGFLRGGVDAIVASAQKTLIGSKTVIIRERWGGAYRLQVRTKTSETPTPVKTQAAIMAHKPGGILLDYATVTGADYLAVFTGYAAYSNLFSAYVTYQGVLNGVPGT
jgi:hypothetical protein